MAESPSSRGCVIAGAERERERREQRGREGGREVRKNNKETEREERGTGEKEKEGEM